MVKDQFQVKIHPSSVLECRPEYVLFDNYVITKANYVRTVSRLTPEIMLKACPNYYDLDTLPESDVKNNIKLVTIRMKHNKKVYAFEQ